MSTTTINTHYGVNIAWTVYRNGHNAFVGTLTLDSVAYDISSRTFSAYIRTPNGTDNKLTLTEGSGITNGGAAGTLTIALTEAQIATLLRDRYFIVIEYTIDSKDYPLCQGYITIHNEANPGTTTTSATIPVSIEGTTVSMAVTIAGAVTADEVLPSQTGNSGKFITTNGTTASWATVVAALTEPSATSVRGGTGSTITTSTRQTVYGINSDADGAQDGTVVGYNSKVGQNAVTIGSQINASTARNESVLIGSLITTGSNSQVILTAYNTSHTFTGVGYIGIGHTLNISNSNLAASVQIGYQSSILDAETYAVVIGPNAKAYVDATYGTANGHQVAIGYNAFGGAWRATAVGGYSQALAVSSTCLGYGAYANKSHGLVMGRGGYNDLANTILLHTDLVTGFNMYLGGVASAHLNPAMPSGGEAVDISATLTAGTFISKIYGVSGRDAKATPTLTDIRGGHVRYIGGRSTGTALGGEVQFATSPASGVSSNTENSEVIAGSFDAAAYSAGTVETRFFLLDLSDGSLKRVSFGADDSAGTGFKVLRVAN